MANKERRLHDLTYGEISVIVQQIENERDMWRHIAEQALDHGDAGLVQARKARESLLKRDGGPRSTIHESVEFVVDMMNSGGANPDHVYPRGNRYHGD